MTGSNKRGSWLHIPVEFYNHSGLIQLHGCFRHTRHRYILLHTRNRFGVRTIDTLADKKISMTCIECVYVHVYICVCVCTG